MNGNAIFKCEISGFPSPSITWLHNGISLNKNGKELLLQNIQIPNTGMYQCMVKNDGNMVQATGELRFSGM